MPAYTPTAMVAKRSRPKPSKICAILWRFAAERHRVYEIRVAGLGHPWTSDPVLSSFKFTNAYRAADRVSQYLIRLMYADDDATDGTIFLRTILFKVFNKIETWEQIVQAMGVPIAGQFDFDGCGDLLERLRAGGRSIYSGAYIMPSGGRKGTPKHRMHLGLIRQMLDDDLPKRLRETRTLAEVYRLLLGYPSIGPFLAFQYAIDLNYSPLLEHSEQEFVVAGPGALDGLSKCFESLGDYSPEDTIRWFADTQAEEFDRHEQEFHGLWGRPLQPIDMQNLFCEVSKYTRATNPEVKGVAGRTRIKQRFRATGELPRPFFPPKWGLNDEVIRWMAARPSPN